MAGDRLSCKHVPVFLFYKGASMTLTAGEYTRRFIQEVFSEFQKRGRYSGVLAKDMAKVLSAVHQHPFLDGFHGNASTISNGAEPVKRAQDFVEHFLKIWANPTESDIKTAIREGSILLIEELSSGQDMDDL